MTHENGFGSGRLAKAWTWLKIYEEVIDYTMQDHMLDRIRNLESAAADLQAVRHGPVEPG